MGNNAHGRIFLILVEGMYRVSKYVRTYAWSEVLTLERGASGEGRDQSPVILEDAKRRCVILEKATDVTSFPFPFLVKLLPCISLTRVNQISQCKVLPTMCIKWIFGNGDGYQLIKLSKSPNLDV